MLAEGAEVGGGKARSFAQSTAWQEEKPRPGASLAREAEGIYRPTSADEHHDGQLRRGGGGGGKSKNKRGKGRGGGGGGRGGGKSGERPSNEQPTSHLSAELQADLAGGRRPRHRRRLPSAAPAAVEAVATPSTQIGDLAPAEVDELLVIRSADGAKPRRRAAAAVAAAAKVLSAAAKGRRAPPPAAAPAPAAPAAPAAPSPGRCRRA